MEKVRATKALTILIPHGNNMFHNHPRMGRLAAFAVTVRREYTNKSLSQVLFVYS
jgi:hypothetical protein